MSDNAAALRHDLTKCIDEAEYQLVHPADIEAAIRQLIDALRILATLDGEG